MPAAFSVFEGVLHLMNWILSMTTHGMLYPFVESSSEGYICFLDIIICPNIMLWIVIKILNKFEL
jgi:hypothetical protein